MTAQPQRIGFLLWPATRALTLSLAEEALRAARRLHPEALYEPLFLLAEAPAEEEGWRLPGTAWNGRLEQCSRLFLVADEAPAAVSPALGLALKQLARSGAAIGALSAGIYPLAQLGLLDGYRAAVHWRWHDDFTERFPKVIATNHLFEWDRDRMTACGGMAVLDLLLALLSRDHGAELAGAVSEELVVERIREGNERQRIPLKNRLGSSHPKLTQAVLLMEANIEEPLTTDEIAQHVCVSRRQLERIFKQYLNRVPSQYYLELRLNRAADADADQQVDHPDRPVLRFLFRAALLQRLPQLLRRHSARGPQPAARRQRLRDDLHSRRTRLIANGAAFSVGLCDAPEGGSPRKVAEFATGRRNDRLQQFQRNVAGEQVDHETPAGVVAKDLEQRLFAAPALQAEAVARIDVGGEDETVVDSLDGHGLFPCCSRPRGGVEEVCTRVHRAFTLRLPDAFCRISESRGNSRVGAITSCRMAAMPARSQSLQSFHR